MVNDVLCRSSRIFTASRPALRGRSREAERGRKVSFLNRSSPAIRLVCNRIVDVEDNGHGFNHGHF
jgi:hypothetical protein